MHGERALVRDGAQGGDLVRTIDGAGFARLGEGERGRDHLMRTVAAVPLERRGEHVRRDLGAGAGELDELEAGAEELRRTAFVSGDMRLGMTEHDAPGRGDVC